MIPDDFTGYLLTTKKEGKDYYLHIEDPDHPTTVFRWTTKIVNATLFGSDVNHVDYFMDKLGFNPFTPGKIKVERKHLSVDDIKEITDKYQ